MTHGHIFPRFTPGSEVHLMTQAHDALAASGVKVRRGEMTWKKTHGHSASQQNQETSSLCSNEQVR